MAEIQSINHRHEQIINWLILNPDRTLGDCAAHFNYTQPWLSQIIHSDMFQAEYKERCREVGVLAVHTLANELGALTAKTIEKANAILDVTPSERFVGETLRTTLQALGFSGGAPAAAPGTVLNIQVNAQTILEAREKAAARLEGTTQAKQDPVIVPNPVPAGKAFVAEALNGEAA